MMLMNRWHVICNKVYNHRIKDIQSQYSIDPKAIPETMLTFDILNGGFQKERVSVRKKRGFVCLQFLRGLVSTIFMKSQTYSDNVRCVH